MKQDNKKIVQTQEADLEYVRLVTHISDLWEKAKAKAAVLSHSDLQLKPLKVSRQVVAGMNYRYECIDQNHKKVEVVVYQPLPGTGEAQVTSVNGKDYTK